MGKGNGGAPFKAGARLTAERFGFLRRRTRGYRQKSLNPVGANSV
jgi:hypothetical protein